MVLFIQINMVLLLITKSYAESFNIPVQERDKMKRYIEENQNRNKMHNKTEWWKNFPKDINDFKFLFISGNFSGNFKEQLKILSEQTNTFGSALSSSVLLKLAENIVTFKISNKKLSEKISCLDLVSIE